MRSTLDRPFSTKKYLQNGEKVTHNNLSKLYRDNKSAKDYASAYLKYLSDLLSNLDTKAIANFIEELEKARESGNIVFVVGNGGSAATASHMANDISLDVMKKSGTMRPFRIVSLTDNIPVITAIANDEGFENVFVYQLRVLYNSMDKLVVISASGNSPNVVAAARWVKKKGGIVIGLLGFDGGKLKDICDVCVLVETPKGEYGPVEDIHMIFNHLASNYLQNKVAEEMLNN